MTSKYPTSPLEAWLEESWALDEMERLIRQKDMYDQEHIQKLVGLRQGMAPDYSETALSPTRAQFLDQLDEEIKAHASKHTLVSQLIKLHSSPLGELWDKFRQQLTMAEKAEATYSRNLECAKSILNPAQFWSRVAQAQSWLDLQLPPEDLSLRRSVIQLNSYRAAAFEFYHTKRRDLLEYHQNRLSCVNNILGIRTAPSTSADVAGYHSDFSNLAIGSPGSLESEADTIDDVRGPFSPVEYVNFLNDGKRGTPIFGSDLEADSGMLGRLILGGTHEAISPPPPMFTLPIPESGRVIDSMNCAFRLEEICRRRPPYLALRSVTNPSQGVFPVDKGWLLGVVLVNLPRQLLYLNEERIRSFRNSLPRDQISFIFQKGTSEYEFFKRLWPYTNDANIQLAASAITQAKGTEKILYDIRSKWHPEIDMPLPSHRKWPSGDEGKGGKSKLFGRQPRQSLGSEKSGDRDSH